MRNVPVLLAFLTATLAAACSRVAEPTPIEQQRVSGVSDPVSRVPPSPAPIRVLTSPEDLQSAIGSAPIVLSFDREPFEGQVQALIAQLSLRSFPALAPISFTTTIRRTDQRGRPVTGTDPALPTMRFVDVVPAGNAGTGWVVLSVASMPNGLRSGSGIDNPGGGIGSQVTRFNRSASPVIRQVRLTDKGRVDVIFSERMVFDPSIAATALNATTEGGGACSLVALPLGAYATFSFDCPVAVWSAQRVNLAVSPGLTSQAGAPLGVLRDKGCAASAITAPINISLDFASATSCSTGCKQLSVTQPDTTPPQVSASVDPTCLWAPNQKMVLFSAAAGLTLGATDECDLSPEVRVVDVTSDQPAQGGSPDALWGSTAFCVRQARDGVAPGGRRYTATIEARDAAGNTAQTTVVLTVPHDRDDQRCPAIAPARVVSDTDLRCRQ